MPKAKPAEILGDKPSGTKDSTNRLSAKPRTSGIKESPMLGAGKGDRPAMTKTFATDSDVSKNKVEAHLKPQSSARIATSRKI